MENTSGPIKPFFVGKLPKEKYTDVNELARDIANCLAIDAENIVVDLIALEELKGEPGEKGARGLQGNAGQIGPEGPTGPQGTPGISPHWEGTWLVTDSYQEGDLIYSGNIIYIATEDHSATVATEPGVGVDWTDVWDVFLTPTVNGVTFLPLVTGYSGGGSTNLDGTVTVSLPIPSLYTFDRVAGAGGIMYILQAGTQVTSTPLAGSPPEYVRPSDWSAGTNEKVFRVFL